MAVVRNFGPLAKANIPEGWQESQYAADMIGARLMRTFRPPDDQSVEITFFSQGVPIDRRSADLFTALVAPGAATKNLEPQEIRSLRHVLGASNAGDNQFTIDADLPIVQRPSFHLDVACISPVSDKNVLWARGHFQDRDQTPGHYFSGIFFAGEHSAGLVYQLFLQAAARTAFDDYEPAFAGVLQSVVWT